MLAGDLRRPVTLQTRTYTTNDYGEQVETWGSPVTLRANVSDRIAGTRENFETAADQQQARVQVQVEIRYRTGLSPVTHRLLINNVVHDILAILNPDGKQRRLVILCERIAR